MNKVKQVLIVGGGSSGWMAAAYLSVKIPGLRISLIEASDIPIIGVGESTIGLTRRFHESLGLDEKAFMRASNAAFKVGIQFNGFKRPGEAYYHPFGSPDLSEGALGRRNAQAKYSTYHLALRQTDFTPDGGNYAYQIDAGLYGEFLKKQCKARGVNHIIDHVEGAVRDEQGNIRHIQTRSSGELTADLYIDCSGFRSILLSGAMQEPFEPIKHYLLNDRAVAARVPYQDKKKELVTYTGGTALSAGWVWNIPLWSRIGTGYVYSSEFLSDSAAEEEFRKHLGEERVKDLSFNHVKIRHGRHRAPWVKNCVGIGISFGFLEPLESTGLALTQLQIIRLASAIQSGGTSVYQQMFNQDMVGAFDATRDFIIAHYALTQRDDTPYWRYLRDELELPESLLQILVRAKNKADYSTITDNPSVLYTYSNWNFILSGMGLFDDQPEPENIPTVGPVQNHAEYLAAHVHEGEYDGPALREGSRGRVEIAPTW